MRFPLALLWGNANRITGDFAERSAVQRGRNAPLRDIVGIPPEHARSPHPPHHRRVVFRSVRKPEPRCWKCGAFMHLKWRRRMDSNHDRAEFWCAGCGGKIRGMGRTEIDARMDAERRADAARAQRGY